MCVSEYVSVASGRAFSALPATAAVVPSPQSIDALSGSSQPGSETTPETVATMFSAFGPLLPIDTDGATLFTVTVVEDVDENPSPFVSFSPIVVTPSCPTDVNDGVLPTASSYCPSLSKSHA